jgi:chromosome segregation ATPase
VKKKKLKKKELAVRIGRLVDQYTDLNNRLNRVSHDKLTQGLQLEQLGEDNVGLQQRLDEIQRQIEQVVSQEEEQVFVQERAEEYAIEEREKEEKINYLSDHLSFLQEQQQGFKQTLEQESHTADVVANTIDDLRRDIVDLLSHIRRLEESGSELLVSDSRHESEIQRLQNDIAELGRKLDQSRIEREKPQQEMTRLLQQSAQSLGKEIEHLRDQLTEKGGQQKVLEHRLLELGNRIGETGARVESQQLDKVRKDDVLEERLSKLEELARELEPVSKDDIHKLEQQLNQLEQDMESLLEEKNHDLSGRIDTLAGELSELANHPDPLESITREIVPLKEGIETTLGQLREEIDDLHEKYQVLNTDDHEAADWLSSIVSGLDKQAEDSKKLEESLDSVINDITRRVEEITARLIIAERLSKEQDETVEAQSQRLITLAEDVLEQGRHGIELKLTTAALHNNAKDLKEGNRKLTEQLETMSQALQQGEQKQGQASDQLTLLEQEQKVFREHSEQTLDSLQERVKTSMAQLAEQSGLNEGLSQRLEDLEASLQVQFNDIDDRFQQLLNSTSESREMLAFQGQRMNTLSSEITELKAQHQGLLEQGDKHNTFLEAMTTEYDKCQEEAEQMVHRLDHLGAQVQSTRSSVTHQGIAIGGLFLLLLICVVLGYQFISSKLGSTERDLSLEMMRVSENYLNRQQVEALVNGLAAADDSGNDSLVVEALIEQQQGISQRMDELEQQFTESTPVLGEQMSDTGQIAMAETVERPTPGSLTDDSQAKQPPQQPIEPSEPTQVRWQALRDRGGYTIQLVGVSSQDSIAGFAARHGLQGELAYITTQREGQAWHILIYGMYESYAEASQALQRLPDSLKSQQPWARKMPGKGSISGF